MPVTILKPKIIDLGLSFDDEGFGALGPELFVTGHHSAGATDHSDVHAIGLCRNYHADHKAKGWEGIGYHVNITRCGTILLLRPPTRKGAHTGLENSNNLGVLFHGTVGDKPTIRQRRAFRWYIEHAHTKKLPAKHRTDRDLRSCKFLGHKDWPRHKSNACPGTHHRMILTRGTAR